MVHSTSPGAGGVSRGRGDAALNFSGETPESAERFKEAALEPSAALDLENSVLLGLGAGAPKFDPSAEASQLAPVRASAGEASSKRRLAPHHREAVRGFFGGDSR